MNEMLQITCAELRDLVDISPDELEVIVEMMIEAEVDICREG